MSRPPRDSREPRRPSQRGARAQRRRHAHYFKPTPFGEADVYRVLRMFRVTDQAIGHAIKKLMLPGKRGGGKSVGQDVQEAIDTLGRWQEMEREDAGAGRRARR